ASSVDGLCDAWPAQWRVDPDDPAQLAGALARLLDAESQAKQDLVASGRSMMHQLTSSDPSADVANCLERAVAGE
ncbi:MAG: hypothetical protein M3Y23_04870, partial [Actinomycetota bacterium]|nr:hypothetical protein [Actinomycetota bacterium]